MRCEDSPAVGDSSPAAFAGGGEGSSGDVGEGSDSTAQSAGRSSGGESGRDVLEAEKRKGQSLALAPASSSPVGSSEHRARHSHVLAVNRCRGW